MTVSPIFFFVRFLVLKTTGWLIRRYTISHQLTVAKVHHPSFNRWTAQISQKMRLSGMHKTQTLLTPVGWTTSLEIPAKIYLHDLKPGMIIQAKWSPILGEVMSYQIVGELPPQMIPLPLIPDWDDLDRRTIAQTFLPLFVTGIIVWLLFVFMALTGEEGITIKGMAIAAAIVAVFGLIWWKSRPNQ